MNYEENLQPNKTLCTITFIYDVKGVIGSGENKTDTIFAWVEDGANDHDCVPLFIPPPKIGKGQCVIRQIIIFKIPTVKKKLIIAP